ncbi:MAG: GNAT family N-acetyltransferase [Pseudomonadota bacterium]
MIPLGPEDRADIERLLSAQPALAMFPLGNLVTHGFGGDHSHGMTFWGDGHPPRAVLGVSNSGGVMPFWDDPSHAAAASDILRGRALNGFVGPAAMVRPLMRELGLEDGTCTLDADEPHFLLDLDRLAVPDGPGTLAPLTVDPETAIHWRRAYTAELHMPTAEDGSADDVARWITADSHRFLMIDGRPAALTGFNARLPHIVQVGGVYTPPGARGRGLARRVVALHLAEARAAGVRQATLFAASNAAVACYRPLGFERIGDFALVLFDGPVTP